MNFLFAPDHPRHLQKIVESYLNPNCLLLLSLKDGNLEPRQMYDLLEYLLNDFQNENWVYLQDYSLVLMSLTRSIHQYSSYLKNLLMDLLAQYLLIALQFPSCYGIRFLYIHFPWLNPLTHQPLAIFDSLFQKEPYRWLPSFLSVIPDPFLAFHRTGLYYCLWYKENDLLRIKWTKLDPKHDIPLLVKKDLLNVIRIWHLIQNDERLVFMTYQFICQLPIEDPEKKEKKIWLEQQLLHSQFSNARIFALYGSAGSNDLNLLKQLGQKDLPWRHAADSKILCLLSQALANNQLRNLDFLLDQCHEMLSVDRQQHLDKWIAYLPFLCQNPTIMQKFFACTDLTLKDLSLVAAIRINCGEAIHFILQHFYDIEWTTEPLFPALDYILKKQTWNYLLLIQKANVFQPKHILYVIIGGEDYITQSNRFEMVQIMLMNAKSIVYRQVLDILVPKQEKRFIPYIRFCIQQIPNFIPANHYDTLQTKTELTPTLRQHQWKFKKRKCDV